ncbi:MAG: hypothetical protein IJD33_04105 [Clostridia bacterium]|nr:hypothetical protein [Clostridia bacterium]
MKKLTVLASLALAVTIGGVYAAWNYAEEGVTAAYATGTVGITGVEGKTTKGTLSASGTNLALKVDDVSSDTKQHTTILTYNADGYFTVTFTPNSNATEVIKTNGIDLEWYVTLADTSNQTVMDLSAVTFDYDLNGDGTIQEDEKKPIYTAIDSSIKTKIERGDYVSNTNGVFTYTVPLATVMGRVHLAEIVLETEDMHNKYSAVLNSYILQFHVGEYVETTQP